MSLKEYERLKTKVERLQREADRAAGIRDEKMDRLKEEFGCTSLAEARKLLKTVEQEAEEAEAKYAEALGAFKEKWEDQL